MEHDGNSPSISACACDASIWMTAPSTQPPLSLLIHLGRRGRHVDRSGHLPDPHRTKASGGGLGRSAVRDQRAAVFHRRSRRIRWRDPAPRETARRRRRAQWTGHADCGRRRNRRLVVGPMLGRNALQPAGSVSLLLNTAHGESQLPHRKHQLRRRVDMTGSD